MTAEALAIHLETSCEAIERELAVMFFGSRVEHTGDVDPIYRAVAR